MTTTVTPTHRLTLEEWLARPDTEPASEYVCGEVFQKPLPNLPHGILQGFFVIVIGEWLRRNRIGRIVPELRSLFGPLTGHRGYVPDLAFCSFSRLGYGDPRDQIPYRQPPDLAIEILSPDQGMGRFTEKIVFFLRHGVRLIWVVDAQAETITVLRPDADPVTLTVTDTLDGADVLPGFTLPVAEIFAEFAAVPASFEDNADQTPATGE